MESKIKTLTKKKYNKLVRDKIPEIIKKNGETPTIKILDDDQFKYELERKLQEEYQEVLNATNSKNRLEELADMLEVISTLATLEGSNLNEVISIMNTKREKRGGFSQKIFLEKVLEEK